MPIIYRCQHCQQPQSIATRRAGQMVDCPVCGQPTRVPAEPAEEVSEHVSAPPAEEFPAFIPDPQLLAKLAAADEGAATKPSGREDEDGGLPLRRVRWPMEEMDLTPMVDVTFLLLIFFMITASFSLQKSIEVPSPDPPRQGAMQSQQELDDLLAQSLRIEIDERNRISIDGDPVNDRGELRNVIEERSLVDDKSEAVLAADDRALWETTILVIDACQAAGLQRIRMAGSATGRD